MLESGQNHNPSLTPHAMASKEVFLTRPIRDVKGEYGGQTCFAFDIQRPLWIVSGVHLLAELGTCRYGVCYFSELDDTSTNGEYRDNPNVLFEAGMLHGRSDSDAQKPASWIPIREKASSPAPFDFAAERMILVPRTRKGTLQKKQFQELFRKRLDGLVQLRR